ncbi:MAG: tetratricopeptide repeat protein [Acidobacteria bacterium]|nr:MAG: tetratricopeptide repeat protein [Acidobacteriota bacterium]
METRTRAILKAVGLLLGVLLMAIPIAADTLDRDESWSELASDGKSLVFGRFVGKFDSIEFRSRRIRLREVSTGKNVTLEIDDALGYIAETIKPGLYNLLGFEAVYYPRVRPAKPGKYRPLRQRFGLSPKSGDAQAAFIQIPEDRPVYIGTIQASNELDGIVYRGHQLRVLDEYEEAFARLESFFPALTASLDREGIVPARHFMLKPTRQREPLERVVGLDDPIRQARDYIADGKYRQAISWLETFMPASDGERSEAKLLIGEALLGNGEYPEAIEELGEVLLIDPEATRALRLLARAHALDGHLEDARDLYTALTVAIPDDAEAHLHLGYLHALKENAVGAEEEFHAAFQTDFDYLLNDVVPFFVAMKATMADDVGSYLPPRVVRYRTPPPKAMDSRRQSKSGGFAVLIDHRGKVIAAQIGAQSSGTMPLMMLSLVRAIFEPASLNGIPIPAIVSLGSPMRAQ